MTWGLLVRRYCVRCETPLTRDERISCCDCTLVIGPKPEDSHMVCMDCGDAWANDKTGICTPCLAYADTDNTHAI